MRKLISACVIGATLLVAAPAAGQEPVAVDERAIIDPTSEDTPTPTPTATASAAPGDPGGEATATPTPTGNNAAMRGAPAKREEAKARCVANTSRLLAAGGSQRVDAERSWAALPFLIAAVCAALVLGAYVIRRRSASSQEDRTPASLLEVVATIVAICAGVAGLAAQFVPGVGVDDAPAPSATMDVRTVNARITREEFAQRIGTPVPGASIDRREVGNVIWLHLKLKGYRGRRLDLQWGSYESKGGGALIAATTHKTRLEVSADSDEQSRFQPVWVGYPGLAFKVQFRLLDRGEVREIAGTGPMNGTRPRYACDRS